MNKKHTMWISFLLCLSVMIFGIFLEKTNVKAAPLDETVITAADYGDY